MAHTVRSGAGTRAGTRVGTRTGGRPVDADETSQGRAARVLTLVTGVVFLVVGIVGFLVTGFDDFASHETHDKLLVFELNGLHNVAHLAFGVLGLLMWRTYRTARAFGLILVVGYAAVLAFGIAAQNEDWNVLNINTADNWLHAGFIALGAVIAGLAHKAAHQDIDLRDQQV
jgi:hypothetical protein